MWNMIAGIGAAAIITGLAVLFGWWLERRKANNKASKVTLMRLRSIAEDMESDARTFERLGYDVASVAMKDYVVLMRRLLDDE